MAKYIFYMMRGEKMCALHAIMNALDLSEAGHEVRIVLEGQAVTLVQVFQEEKNPLFAKALSKNLIAGVCKACSQVLGVMAYNSTSGLPLLDDMLGHAGVKPYVEQGFEVIVM